jgi:hypothetical protein
MEGTVVTGEADSEVWRVQWWLVKRTVKYEE